MRWENRPLGPFYIKKRTAVWFLVALGFAAFVLLEPLVTSLMQVL